MQDFKKLKVWEKAHEITLSTYRITQSFPSEERYGLISQMRRASSSIPSNIAEGSSRGSDADFRRFLFIALGSSSELEYQYILAYDLGFVTESAYSEVSEQVITLKRMLNSFIQKL